jgi:hypothetical protein
VGLATANSAVAIAVPTTNVYRNRGIICASLIVEQALETSTPTYAKLTPRSLIVNQPLPFMRSPVPRPATRQRYST